MGSLYRNFKTAFNRFTYTFNFNLAHAARDSTLIEVMAHASYASRIVRFTSAKIV